MRDAVIDLGSNTIKFCVYETRPNIQFLQLHYETAYAYIISDVQDGQLLPDGIRKIIAVLRDYQGKAAAWGCGRILCFSTASLREISNRDAVRKEVHSACGILIHPLSGQEEAYCNFISMQRAVAESTFVGADIGGGSLQTIFCRQGTLEFRESFPLGGLKLYQQFVSSTFPTGKEAAAITDYVKQTLAICPPPPSGGSGTLYFMGGATRMISQLLHCEDGCILPDRLGELIQTFLSDTAAAKTAIETVTPERLKTIMPSMIVIHTTALTFGCTAIQSITNSVREGYLIQNLAEEGETYERK